MDIEAIEIIELWTCFKKNNLEYLMVGGLATALHGFHRVTGDIDIWIKDTKENRIKLSDSLENYGYGEIPNVENIQFIPGWTSIMLPNQIELDIMTDLKKFPQSKFDECLNMASISIINELEIPFLHINHLIDEKKATNRSKDKIDVLELEKIKLSREKP